LNRLIDGVKKKKIRRNEIFFFFLQVYRQDKELNFAEKQTNEIEDLKEQIEILR
jgi:hypothetical protein